MGEMVMTLSRSRERLDVALVERRDEPGCWAVEAIDNANEGACYVTVFYGPESRARAVEYARMKYDWRD